MRLMRELCRDYLNKMEYQQLKAKNQVWAVENKNITVLRYNTLFEAYMTAISKHGHVMFAK
jgi:hypothetical protein